MKARYLDSLMKQEVSYFEKQNVEAIPSKISEQFTMLGEGIGEKYGLSLSSIGNIISGISICLIVSPTLGLCLLIYFPIFELIIKTLTKKMIEQVMKKMAKS